MRHAIVTAAILIVALAPLRAHAQSWEASAFVGWTPSAALDRRAPELDEVSVRGGVTWGLQGSRRLTSRWAAEVLFADQAAALAVETADGSADLFTMRLRQLQGNAVYQFASPGGRLRPFAFAGLGAAFFSADALESETKLSLGFGAGVKYFLSDRFGVRGHFRYKPTLLNDDEDAGDFCDPFGFCQGTLQQIEIAFGGVVAF